MGKAAMFEVRRDIDIGARVLRRGTKVSLEEIEKVAPGKSGPLRRTGILRPVGESAHDELKWRRDERHGRLTQSNQKQVETLRAGVPDES